MPRLEKRTKPTTSPEMSQVTFGKEVALLAQAGYNPSEIIGHNAGGRSVMEIMDLIQETLRNAEV